MVPRSLTWLVDEPGGTAWIAALPGRVATLATAWHLDAIGAPFPGANVSYVVPARQAGRAVVLKLQWPHEECRYEAEALAVWNGQGAVRLLDHDPRHHALLLERCVPGGALSDARGIDPIDVLIDLLPRLWQPAAGPFKTLAEEAEGWAEGMPAQWEKAGRPLDRTIIDQARDWAHDLKDSQGAQVLVHQDLHGDNILSSGDIWLAIDPKPLIGERAFALAPIIRSFEFGGSRDAVIGRLDRLSAALGIDRERARRWAIVQTLAWGLEGAYSTRHRRTVSHLLAAG